MNDTEYANALADGAETEVRRLEEGIWSGGTTIKLVGRFGSIHDGDPS